MTATPAPTTAPDCAGRARARRQAVRRVRARYRDGALRIQRYVADVYSGGWFFTRDERGRTTTHERRASE